MKILFVDAGNYCRSPAAEAVCRALASRAGHAEAVEVHYDPTQITYAELLEMFWHNIDPTTRDRQFPGSTRSGWVCAGP